MGKLSKDQIAEANRRAASWIFQKYGRGGSRRGDSVTFRSPLREDKRPSFSLDLSSGRYYDHATRASGSALDAVQELGGKTFREVVQRFGGDNIRTETTEIVDRARERQAEAIGQPFPLTEGLVTSLRDKYGRGCGNVYPYLDSSGKHLLQVVFRYEDGKGGKRFLPVVNHKNEWINRYFTRAGLTPLYGLHRAKTAGVVVLCEGEKAADAVNQAGFVGLGYRPSVNHHYAKLVGCSVRIWADDDKPGQQHASRVLAHCQSAGLETKLINIKAVKLAAPLFPEGGDAADLSPDQIKRVLRTC